MPPAAPLQCLLRCSLRTPARRVAHARHFQTSARMGSVSTAAALYAVVSTPASAAKKPSGATDLEHHAKGGEGFINPWPSYREQSVVQILSSLIWRQLSFQSRTPDLSPSSITVAVRKPDLLPSRTSSASLRATWLGHASYYLEFPSGLRVLTDPVFTPRCSPFTFMGPKRYTPAPAQIPDLPFLDAVIISHTHYDHLSLTDMHAIKKHFPTAHFFVPLGVKKWFHETCGITNVTELDWWESRDLALSPSQPTTPEVQPAGANAPADAITATIHCVPSQHTSARTAFDKASTLWAGAVITSGGKSVYFAGDTGYRTVPDLTSRKDQSQDWTDADYAPEHADLPVCPAFAQIGECRGPFDLGLIPIGAYAPRWIMSPMHANPFDAVRIFKETRCKKAMGIHWGTWVLTEEDVMEPPKLLKEASEKAGLEAGQFDVCDIGESREF